MMYAMFKNKLKKPDKNDMGEEVIVLSRIVD